MENGSYSSWLNGPSNVLVRELILFLIGEHADLYAFSWLFSLMIVNSFYLYSDLLL